MYPTCQEPRLAGRTPSGPRFPFWWRSGLFVVSRFMRVSHGNKINHATLPRLGRGTFPHSLYPIDLRAAFGGGCRSRLSVVLVTSQDSRDRSGVGHTQGNEPGEQEKFCYLIRGFNQSDKMCTPTSATRTTPNNIRRRQGLDVPDCCVY